MYRRGLQRGIFSFKCPPASLVLADNEGLGRHLSVAATLRRHFVPHDAPALTSLNSQGKFQELNSPGLRRWPKSPY